MKIVKILVVGTLMLSGCAHISSPLKGGHCPPAFPVKGNADSFVYHMPSGHFYQSTKAEICFESYTVARRHGYRASQL